MKISRTYLPPDVAMVNLVFNSQILSGSNEGGGENEQYSIMRPFDEPELFDMTSLF